MSRLTGCDHFLSHRGKHIGREPDRWRDDVVPFKAISDQSGGGLTAIEGVLRARKRLPPLHLHREQDEFIYTLEGTFTVMLGDDLIEAIPRLFVFIPRNTQHPWQTSVTDARALCCHPHTGEHGVRGVLPALRRVPPEERGIEAFSRLAAETRAMEGLGPAARAVRPALYPGRHGLPRSDDYGHVGCRTRRHSDVRLGARPRGFRIGTSQPVAGSRSRRVRELAPRARTHVEQAHRSSEAEHAHHRGMPEQTTAHLAQGCSS